MIDINYRINILGCPIDNLTLKQTIDLIDKFIKSKKPHQHVVVNADKLLKVRKDNKLKDIIGKCDIINADGMAIVWASKIIGKPLKQRVAGIDLMQILAEHAIIKNYRLYFLGAKQEIITKVVAIYKKKYPELQIVGFKNGYWKPEAENDVINSILLAKPDILFVAISSPKKEYFLKKYLDILKVPFVMGVGGSFDVVAGLTKRAPKCMQRIGLEWLWRFIQEPGRLWKRYLIGNVIFIWVVIKEFIKIRILKKAEVEQK